MFVMTLGGFGDIWEEIPNTKHEVIGMVKDLVLIVLIRIQLGKFHWFLFIALLVILLLNLLIAMMGDTYAKVQHSILNRNHSY